MKQKIKMCFYTSLVLFAFIVCAQVYAVNQPTTIWMIAPEIQLDLGLQNITIGDNQSIEVGVYNPNDYSTLGNLSIKIGRRTEAGPYEYLSENVIVDKFTVEIGANNTQYVKYNWSSATATNGTYKAYLRFEYNGTYTTRYTTFEILADESNNTETIDDTVNETIPTDGGSGGEERLEIISTQKNLDFGAMSTIGIKYYSGSKNHSKFRVVGYVSGPKKISYDLDEKTIYRNFCEVNTGVEIRNVYEHNVFYLNIPIFIKDNCDDTFLLGDYEITVRSCIYNENGWMYYNDRKLKVKLNLNLSQNKNCKNSAKVGNSCEESIDNSNNEQSVNYLKIDNAQTQSLVKNKIYDLVEFDEIVNLGDVFNTKITIFNSENYSRNITMYAYVFDNTTLISDGFNGSFWSHNWNANKIVFEMNANSNKTVTLTNKIDDVPPRLYRFRIRLFYSGKKYDINRWIAVLENSNVERLSVKCNQSNSLGKITITNLDIVDNSVNYYIFYDDFWYSDEVKIKKKSQKVVEFSLKEHNATIIVTDNIRRLYKCYVTPKSVDVVNNKSEVAVVTGYVSRDIGAKKEGGVLAWLFRVLGLD